MCDVPRLLCLVAAASPKIVTTSAQKRKSLAPDRVRSASLARAFHPQAHPAARVAACFLSPRRPSRTRLSPSPASTPGSAEASTPSRTRCPSPRPPALLPRTAACPRRARRALIHTRKWRGRPERQARSPDRAALRCGTDSALFARVWLLEEECVRVRSRVRELEARQPGLDGHQLQAPQHSLKSDVADEDADEPCALRSTCSSSPISHGRAC